MRSMKIQSGYSDKQSARVLTVDQERRRVEVALKDGGVAYAAVWELPNLFRWPKTGEIWTIRRDSGIWRLDSIVEDMNHLEGSTSLADLEEGQARILAESSTEGSGVLINKFHIGRTVSFTIGDGAEDEFQVEHDLGTERVDYAMQDNGTGTRVYADFEVVDENTVTIGFGVVPTEDQYTVTLFG